MTHEAPLLPTSRFRNEYRIPFRLTPTGLTQLKVSHLAHVCRNGFSLRLRIDSPMCKCCSHGTLLHFGLQSSHLNTCYYHQDLHLWQLDPGPRPKLQRIPQRPSYSTKFDMYEDISTLPVQHRFTTLQRHPFSGLVDSAGELLHTPWRVPTSMATVLLSLSTNTFNGIR